MAKASAAKPLDELIDGSTLLGDLRDAILDRLRAMPKPYTVMSEKEQQELIDGCERVSRHLVTEATRLIAANGFPSIRGTLVKATIKDGLQTQIDFSRHDAQRHTFIDAVGGSVIVILAEPDIFMGETAPARPDEKPVIENGQEGEAGVLPFKGKD